jgi:hypothetical protein
MDRSTALDLRLRAKLRETNDLMRPGTYSRARGLVRFPWRGERGENVDVQPTTIVAADGTRSAFVPQPHASRRQSRTHHERLATAVRPEPTAISPTLFTLSSADLASMGIRPIGNIE